ncbi:MAG: ThuA domain-containing protein [Actinomycetota bacterium]|nr:trehalose utilization [Acidimicrobiaceae bacterium]MEC7916254.1 ThuA domain-containing protein [Actinomycetota bacterium]MEC9058147.1 ThuA domain-containing protein [Actinomycetota bacterium]MEE3256260.1 ThuA domain-containing protein [Actinomycetota bacterium]
MSERTERVDAYLVTGGKYHDIDFARGELLSLLAEHSHVRVTVVPDYESLGGIADAQFLVSYTCDVRPSEKAQAVLWGWVENGGRWLALHGTNAALDLPRPTGVEAPRCFPTWAKLLGSQFVAHPPIHLYRVELSDPDHWLVADIEQFETDDELYLMEHHDANDLIPLLHTNWSGEATGFAESDWTQSERHLVQYLRPLGAGGVLYNTLGHCRGHWDMQPLMDYYPVIERCSWEQPMYYELLRRGIRWAMGSSI